MLKKLDLNKDAIDMFVNAVHRTPTLWAAWVELSLLVADKDMVGYIRMIVVYSLKCG